VKWQLGKFLAQGFPSNLQVEFRQMMRPRDSIELWNSFQVPNNYVLRHLTLAEQVNDTREWSGVRTLMNNKTEWTGTATKLLEVLGWIAGDTITRSRHWPGASHILSGRLRRAATFLRKVGIEIDFGAREGRASNKIIRIVAELQPADGQARAAATADDELPF